MTKANDCQTINNPIKQFSKPGQKVRLYCAAVDDITLRKGSTLLVLSIMLFQFHNTKGGRCDPSEETIGLKCGLSERQVRRCIKILMKQGWVTIKQRRYNDSNLYDFAWNKVPNEDISGQSMRTFQVVNEDISGHQTGHIGSVNEDMGVRLTQEYNTGSRTQEKNSLSEREVLLIDSPNKPNNQVKPPNLHKKPQFPVFGINEARGDLRFIKPDKIPAMRKWLLSLGLPSNKVK